MAKQLKILSVDDDFINRKLINLMLRKNTDVGEVLEASNGLEALNLLKVTRDIDLVLLDIKMPVMNGIEFLTAIALIGGLNQIPVIVLTTDETTKYEALEKGAQDFLVKPIREYILSEKIKKIAEVL